MVKPFPESDQINVKTIVVEPSAGAQIWSCQQAMAKLCVATETTVEARFNDNLYRVRYSDIMEQVKGIRDDAAPV